MSQREALEDSYEGWKANWYFLYYSITFIIFQCFNWAAILLQEHYHEDIKLYWLLNLGICLVVDFVILDFIAVALGKSESGLGGCLRKRGFYYDYSLHDLFDQIDNE